MSLAAGKLPSFYRVVQSLELPDAAIDERLSVVLTGFEATLRAHLAGYDKLPDGVKMALLDMTYNLGPEGLLKGYPKMLHAIEMGTWPEAAAECARGGINAARNAWTRQQMLSAATVTIKAEIGNEIASETESAKNWLKKIWHLLLRVFRWSRKDCCR
jgi:hypothetical protein